MNAETAAGQGDTGQETNVSETENAGEERGQRSEVRDQRSEEAAEETSTPVGELLGLMDGISPELRQEVEQSHDKEQEQESVRRTSAGRGEQAGKDGGAAGERAGEEKAEKRKAEKPKLEDEDEPLSEEQKQKWPKEALGRIHKTTRQREDARAETKKERDARVAAEGERDQLREQVKGFKPVVVQPSGRDPLADVTTVENLAKAEKQWEELLEFAERYPDGVEDLVVGYDKERNPLTQSYTKEQVAEMRVQASRMLRKAIPERQNYLAQYADSQALAREEFPEMFETEKPEYEIRNKLLERIPEIQRFHDHDIWIAHAINGLKLHVANPESLRAMAQKLIERAETAEAAADGTGGGKNGKTTPDPKLKPFLQPKRAIAPALASTPAGGRRSEGETDSDRKVKSAEKIAIDSLGEDDALIALTDAISEREPGEVAEALA